MKDYRKKPGQLDTFTEDVENTRTLDDTTFNETIDKDQGTEQSDTDERQPDKVRGRLNKSTPEIHCKSNPNTLRHGAITIYEEH